MRYDYKWTKNYDEAMPDNNYGEEIFSVDLYGEYDFIDWLRDHDYTDFVATENGEYIIVDDDDEPTGERYSVVNTEQIAFTIKPEHLEDFGNDVPADYVITEEELCTLAAEWEKEPDDLIYMLEEI